MVIRSKLTQENNEVKQIVQYDQSMCDFLLKNSFTSDNILDICHSGLLVIYCARNKIMDAVNKFQNEHKNGCIFSLPSKRRDGKIIVYWSPMSSNEIRRTVALKAFL